MPFKFAGMVLYKVPFLSVYISLRTGSALQYSVTNGSIFFHVIRFFCFKAGSLSLNLTLPRFYLTKQPGSVFLP